MRALILTLGVSLCSLGVLVLWSACVAASRADDAMEAFWLARERARR
jgi:hypothetical protein